MIAEAWFRAGEDRHHNGVSTSDEREDISTSDGKIG